MTTSHEWPDNAERSDYYKKHQKRPHCPYCGTIMHFRCYANYEGKVQFWTCETCGLSSPDLQDFPREFRKSLRIMRKKEIKIKMKELEQELSRLKELLALYGKYMSDEEKIELMMDEIEGEE